jgi:DNA-binding transcriptional regulator YiaG
MTTETEQAALLRDARERLGLKNEELAAQLGVSLSTLRNWIAPTSSRMHREMPLTAQLLLARILADKPKSRRKKAV